MSCVFFLWLECEHAVRSTSDRIKTTDIFLFIFVLPILKIIFIFIKFRLHKHFLDNFLLLFFYTNTIFIFIFCFINYLLHINIRLGAPSFFSIDSICLDACYLKTILVNY